MMKAIAELTVPGLHRRRKQLINMPLTAKTTTKIQEIDKRLAAEHGKNRVVTPLEYRPEKLLLQPYRKVSRD